MRNIFIAIVIALVLILLGAYAWTRLGLRERVSQNTTDTQPLPQAADATFIPFPTSVTIPGLTMASTAPVASSSASPIPATTYNCRYLIATPASGVAPLTTKLTATGSAVGNERAYIFDFGEATPATQTTSSVSHTYQKPGTYIAKLEVRNNKGNKVNLGEDCWRTITVTDKPQATSKGGVSQLPQTGPEEFLLLALVPMIGAGVYLYKRFKLL